ncbi:uncharacterized protein LOC121367251 [Gigantopelta aegis]|uniref:uncharacterized protein LOC121367251 n=1 Tax=Gigantopelta aegis TaxID=1735272 RepID=UPI001B8891E1|nr:uncharacterized protein LOC121367251 [Gigantopelta aegis]
MEDCSGDVCSGRSQKTWFQANQSCRLLKLTPERMTSIKNIIGQSWQSYAYWVGLSRDSELLWRDGTPVLNAVRLADSDDRACLNEYVLGLNLTRTEASPCDWTLRAICEIKKVAHTTAKPPTSTPASTITSSTTTTMTSVSTRSISQQQQSENNKTDIVAVTVPVIAILLALAVGTILVCYFKRKNKLVFVVQKFTSFKQPKQTKEPEYDNQSLDSGLCYESNDDSSFTSEYDVTNPDYDITGHYAGVYQNTETAERATSDNEAEAYRNATVTKGGARSGNCVENKDGAVGVVGVDNRAFYVTDEAEHQSRDTKQGKDVYYKNTTSRYSGIHRDLWGRDKKVNGEFGPYLDQQGYELAVPDRRETLDSRHLTQGQIYTQIEDVTMPTDDDLYEIPVFREHNDDSSTSQTTPTNHVTKQSGPSDHVTCLANHLIAKDEDVDDVEYWTVDDVDDFKKITQEELPALTSVSSVCGDPECSQNQQDRVYFVLEESTKTERVYAQNVVAQTRESIGITDSEV